jgi:hypothetical protein
MDRFALEYNLRDASARIVACQEALLSQRFQVRELERCGLDASVARALLEIYEDSKAMAIVNRDSLASTLKMAAFTTAAPANPSIADRPIDDHEPFFDDEFHHRLAA